MTDLYLIAHKVRNEPAFDVATQIECPECSAEGCTECDGNGWWWIIPTSGHRAYPGKYWQFDGLRCGDINIETDAQQFDYSTLADHYPHRANNQPQPTLADRLGLTKSTPKALPPIQRRI